jgi:hypothetical protein
MKCRTCVSLPNCCLPLMMESPTPVLMTLPGTTPVLEVGLVSGPFSVFLICLPACLSPSWSFLSVLVLDFCCPSLCMLPLPLSCISLFSVSCCLSRFVLSCLVLSCLVLSCLVLSCLVLSCLVLSCLVLPCHVSSSLSLYFLRISVVWLNGPRNLTSKPKP